MELRAAPDSALLQSLWREAARDLEHRRNGELAERFGYAVKHDRDAAAAIRQDLESCLDQIGVSSLASPDAHLPSVTFYEPNDAHLLAAVDGVIATLADNNVTLSLVVTGSDGRLFVTLEGISSPPGSNAPIGADG